MFILKKGCRTAETVNQLYEYMIEAGLKCRLYGKNDTSPYVILNSETSIGYRIRSKWNQKGIVLFCAADEVDKNNIVNELNLAVCDNSSDPYRPYAIFIPENKFEKVVELLKLNSINFGDSVK